MGIEKYKKLCYNKGDDVWLNLEIIRYMMIKVS